MTDRRFGISTHLFHDSRLAPAHLALIARAGFETVEIVATRSHVDYTDPHAIQALARALADARLSLHAVHAPVAEARRGDTWVGAYSTAAAEEARRRVAVDQARAALDIAHVVPFQFLVLHLGVASTPGPPDGDNAPSAARRSLEEVVDLARAVGVTVAVEVLSNNLSSPDALVHLLEDTEELGGTGLCLDLGHAHLFGDAVEAIEATSGHVLTTHLHDNRGRRDEHLVPGEGTIAWDAAVMALQKVGYDGVLMFEVAGGGADPASVLRRCADARRRLDAMFVTF